MNTSTALATREQLDALDAMESRAMAPGDLYRSAGYVPAVPGAETIREQRAKAGIDFPVEVAPLFHLDAAGNTIRAANHAVTRNANTLDVFGLVRESYKVVPFSSMDDVLGMVVDSGAGMVDGCLRLRGGAIGIGRVRLAQPIMVKGDLPMHAYFNIIVPHDGMLAWGALASIIRPVCENTMRAAIRDAKGRGSIIKIRHTATAQKRVDAVTDAMRRTLTQMAAFERDANRMAATRMTDGQMMTVVNRLLPEGDAGITAQLSKARTKLMDLWTTGTGINGAIRGTAWAAFNAVTEYADHYTRIREETPEKRVESNLFGRSDALKAAAPYVIEDVVGELA
jgi:phage/plasmid-like protein (TIGR03299 family)